MPTHPALQRFGSYIVKTFNTHPTETGENYGEHLWFTTRMSLRFVFVSIVLMLHGIFPFIFVRTASLQIEKIYLIMRSRIPVARREEIETLNFEI